MNRRHGLFLAIAIGLAAIAGTYAALQTTDLGAQAATLSEQQIAEADVRLDEQEAALRRAAKKRPPRLPELPAKASGGAAAGASGAPAPAAPAPAPASSSGSSSSGPSGSSGPGSWDDDGDDDSGDDHSGHGGGGDDDFEDDDHSGHGGGGDDD
jgi:hypothetical protein